MNDDLILVATYDSPLEAHQARSLLEAAGIASQVADENMMNALPHFGTALGGVKLLVWKSQASKATALLFPDQVKNDKRKKPPKSPRKSWKCRRCRERNEPTFDLCWSCGAEFNADNTTQPIVQSSSDRDTPIDDALPDSTVDLSEGEETSEPEVDAAITRARRAAILGLIMFPVVLHFYSLWLLLSISASGRKFTSNNTRWYYITLAIDLLYLSLFGIVLWLATREW